ncbi:hypothetical protein ACNKU7_04650 [Microbulbifer sp. SA54]|uniref:hypothetical protein n=1 Tax=Microbulbifer sp. SA54 TaxID=3401577 RepID=UPI003AAFCF21
MDMNLVTARAALAIASVIFGIYSTSVTAAPAVAGSNSSNGKVFGICFDDLDGDGQADPRISASIDGGTSPVALAFYLDPLGLTGGTSENARKLFVADEKGQIKAFNWPSSTTDDSCDFSPSPDSRYQYNTASAPSGPASPNGLNVTRGKQLLVLDSVPGNTSAKLWSFDLREGALRSPRLIDPDIQVDQAGTLVSAQLVEESLILPNGDLLVAAAEPAAILKYDAACIGGTAPCAATTLIGADNLSGTPSGIALAPAPLTSKLLVSVTDGAIEVFDLSPVSSGGSPLKQSTPLISGLSHGRFKIKTLRTVSGVNYQTYAGDLYLSGRNNGQIIQMNLLDENGVLTAPRDSFGNYLYQTISSVQFPVGLATTEVNTASATECTRESGCNITPIINHRIFSTNFLDGAIGEQYEVFPDPREVCGGTEISACPVEGEPGYDPACDNSLSLQQLNPEYEDIRIPGYLCGAPNIVVIDVDSTIELTNEVIEHTVEYSNISDDLNCLGADRNLQPVVAWATKSGEDAVVEGRWAVDMTNGCGSVRQLTREYSFFISGIRYLVDENIILPPKKGQQKSADPFIDIVASEVQSLQATFVEAQNSASGTCVVDPDGTLASTLSELGIRYGRGQYRFAQELALELANLIEGDDALINPKNLGCTENYRGEIQSRAKHLWYNINSKVLGKTWGSY